MNICSLRKPAKILAAAILMSATWAFASFATVPVTWNSVTLNESGEARWNASYAQGEAVDKYELQLARMHDGVWKTNYNTYKTSDTSYDISFSSTGKYYYIIRAKFIGGDYSDWSGPSNTVTVTSDDIDHDWEPGYFDYGGTMYNPVYNADGSVTYQVPAGPGANPQMVTVTTNSQYANGTHSATIYNGFNGMGYSNYSTGNTTYSNTAYSGITIGTAPATPASNASTGWIRTGNNWTYRYANGTGPKNGWDRINDKWYYFNAAGIMQTGWIWYNDNWYYCLPDGQMATGWNDIGDKWYYLNQSGIMQTGYVPVDGHVYYCDISGARVENGYNPDGHLFDVNGVMIR